MSAFEGQAALVTGAASGIGRAVALGLARSGCRLCITDIQDLSEVEAAIAALGVQVVAVRADVSVASDVQGVVDAAEQRWGHIDILANIAGIYPIERVEAMAAEQWDRVLAVNLRSVYLACHAVLPGMKRKNYGRIVSLTSGIAHNGAAGGAHYAASKAGIIGFTKSLARELGEYDINVNALAPGITDTPLLHGANSDAQIEAIKRSKTRKSVSQPEDVVEPFLFLVGPGGRHITGQVLALRD